MRRAVVRHHSCARIVRGSSEPALEPAVSLTAHRRCLQAPLLTRSFRFRGCAPLLGQFAAHVMQQGKQARGGRPVDHMIN